MSRTLKSRQPPYNELRGRRRKKSPSNQVYRERVLHHATACASRPVTTVRRSSISKRARYASAKPASTSSKRDLILRASLIPATRDRSRSDQGVAQKVWDVYDDGTFTRTFRDEVQYRPLCHKEDSTLSTLNDESSEDKLLKISKLTPKGYGSVVPKPTDLITQGRPILDLRATRWYGPRTTMRAVLETEKFGTRTLKDRTLRPKLQARES